MKKINNKLALIFSLLLVLTTIVTIIDFYCFDKNFYNHEYENLNTAKDMGLSNEDLNLMTDDLLDYLRSDKPDLKLTVNVNGVNREAFNERETIHMADVKDLYDKAILVKNVSLVITTLIGVYLLVKKYFKEILVEYKKALLIYGFIFSFIGLFCLIDFNSFWINFHKIFFTKNDFWLLDPRTSLLINMVPEKFFFDLVIRIVITIVVLIVGYYFIFKSVKKKVNK